jgi:hypothetical protein
MRAGLIKAGGEPGVRTGAGIVGLIEIIRKATVRIEYLKFNGLKVAGSGRRSAGSDHGDEIAIAIKAEGRSDFALEANAIAAEETLDSSPFGLEKRMNLGLFSLIAPLPPSVFKTQTGHRMLNCRPSQQAQRGPQNWQSTQDITRIMPTIWHLDGKKGKRITRILDLRLSSLGDNSPVEADSAC